jgi:hypothetical protein
MQAIMAKYAVILDREHRHEYNQTRGGDNMGSAAHNRATAKYDALNTIQIRFKLNKKTDADIIEYLESIENRQGYLKSVIRADMKKK